MDASTTPAWDNAKDQIGFCGIWCGSCIVGNGALRELTRRYERTITGYDLKSWGAVDFDYDAFAKGLAAIQRLPACPGCRQGGGRDDCEMRACASAKSVGDCTECDGRSECKHTEMLETMRSGAVAAGLFVKTGLDDRGRIPDRWMTELQTRWPCCVLFTIQQ